MVIRNGPFVYPRFGLPTVRFARTRRTGLEPYTRTLNQRAETGCAPHLHEAHLQEAGAPGKFPFNTSKG